MDLQQINPLDHSAWDDLLLASGDASFFHTAAWARVIVESYGYQPVYFATVDNGMLSFLMPFMDIASPLTGKRGVSLPFTDCCNPFTREKGNLAEGVRAVLDFAEHRNWAYVEWRSTESFIEGAVPAESYLTHDLDLSRTEAELFLNLRGNNRRNIRRAARDGVSVTFDASLESLRDFYRLHGRTRKQHGLPPQPFSFFKNVLKQILARGLGTIASAHYSGRTIAASIFFHFGPAAIFKYGASDARFLDHRPNNLVLWEAIRWYKAKGFKTLSLGRTEAADTGLLHFKRSWGAAETTLKYYRFDLRTKSFCRSFLHGRFPHRLISKVPIPLLRLLGSIFYKHIG
jgi:hypothetical protein